ncbi:unnamed protein product [Lymnaea stagnalis]|uniref:CCDC92/74 N-terminal domain-containing protein n=1 Tax=Lymnaea stagnalis TaxID=6523 RepID=A0AAV2H8G7_LYMST
MIQQGFVHGSNTTSSILELSTMSNTVPPLNTLPHWSRNNALDKVHYPKRFLKDPKSTINYSGLKEGYGDDDILTGNEMNPAQRIQYLERSIVFLRQQHAELLQSLHEEVELLKKENKDLQFKIVMGQRSRSLKEGEDISMNESGMPPTKIPMSKLLENPDKSRAKTEEMKILFLEEEVKELKHALRETRNKNQYLTQLLEQAEKQKEKEKGSIDHVKYEGNPGQTNFNSGQSDVAGMPGVTSGQYTSLSQCHVIIKHLQQVNAKQGHELDRLKLDLRDVLYSHKWTPDAFLMAKAYIAEDDRKEDEKGTSLPRIPLRNPSKKIPEMAYVKENISLPALHLTVGNRAVERKKRTQVLQRAKLQPGSLPP